MAEDLIPPGGYPDNNPKTFIGVNKPGIIHVPPIALLHLGTAMEYGAKKYGHFNWREQRVTNSIYVDAAYRHLMSYWDGEERASDSGAHHLAHVMACCAIMLDAASLGAMNDARGKPGNATLFITSIEEGRKHGND